MGDPALRGKLMEEFGESIVVAKLGAQDICFSLHEADQNFLARAPAAPAAQLVDIPGSPSQAWEYRKAV